jgi:hypothetical protein
MTARPNLSSIPARGITVDGIVDVLGGKSIVVGRSVSATNAYALKGELLVVDGAGAVKTAAQNATLATVAGVAVCSSVTGDIISVLRHGIARLVTAGAALVVGDNVSAYGAGKVCKTGENGVDGSTPTSNIVGEVSSVGDGYVDVEIGRLGAAV